MEKSFIIYLSMGLHLSILLSDADATMTLFVIGGAMKNQQRFSAQRATETQSWSARAKSATRERAPGVIAGGGRIRLSAEDFGFAAETMRLETSWQAETEIILPEQIFRPGGESHAVWTGERRLLLAVLEVAVHSFFRYRDSRTRRGRRLFAETMAWFASGDQDWLYSFETICRHLDLDAEYIRGGLRRWGETATSEETGALSVRAGRSSRSASRLLARAA